MSVTGCICTPTQLRKIITQFCGKQFFKTASKILTDIHCVDIGLKPAFIFDYGYMSSENMSHALDNLEKVKFIQNKLMYFCIDEELFIYRPDIFNKHLGNTIQDFPCIIDVTGSLESPKVVTCGQIQEISLWLESIADQLLSIPSCKVELQQHWNRTTLYGILLGYPVSYWYNMQTDITSTCIDNIPLVVFKCQTTCQQVMRCVDAKQLYTCRKVGTDKQLPHSVYSFSIPLCLMEYVTNDKIMHWFDSIKMSCIDICCKDMIFLEKEVVTLTNVAL